MFKPITKHSKSQPKYFLHSIEELLKKLMLITCKIRYPPYIGYDFLCFNLIHEVNQGN